MRRAVLLALSAATALIAAGCAGGEETVGGETSTAAATLSTPGDPQPTEPMKAGRPAASGGVRLQIVDSEFGRVVADRRGEALYLFDREKAGRSECYGACARAWPPLLTKGRPVAAGVDQGLLGTTRRADGRHQVTYAGHPLYYYVSDSPGTILCHDVVEFGGTWLVVTPSGRPAS